MWNPAFEMMEFDEETATLMMMECASYYHDYVTKLDMKAKERYWLLWEMLVASGTYSQEEFEVEFNELVKALETV